MTAEQRLSQKYDALSDMGALKKEIPKFIKENLNPRFELRHYQTEAIARFIHYLEEYPHRIKPTQLLFNMATGSGKTLLMAADILYLYKNGYRNFLFFVNDTNIIEKTRDNFLNPNSSKYLFNEKIKYDGTEVYVREVSNFDEANERDINIIFTTIQGLHSHLNNPSEDSPTYEDFKDKKNVLISDEAHHINAWTRNKGLGKEETELKRTWEHTVNKILNSNAENVMLEYTATIDIDNAAIFEKYKDKIIFEYDLKQFRLDGYSKEVEVLQADLDDWERMLQAVILSQYRRKVAEKNGIRLKPVVLFKSKTIKESKENYDVFRQKMDSLGTSEIEKIKGIAKGIMEKAFSFFDEEKISFDNLIIELKEDFSEEKCMLLDSKNISPEKQIKLNELEDEKNEIRAIFVVDMLNEGWDVLNLFDIVRLYNTRDAVRNRPGKTTIREAQLIGRGARYYPFHLSLNDEFFKRKFDNEPENDLKIVETLYYHSFNNPRYIDEIKIALKESGLLPYETKEIELKVKPHIKGTAFWKEGRIFYNQKKKANRTHIKTLDDIDIEKTYNSRLYTGFMSENMAFETGKSTATPTTIKNFKLETFEDRIIRKAMARLDFYSFRNLQRYFPSLTSSIDFILSVKKLSVDVEASREKLDNLSPNDELKICTDVLTQLEKEILRGYVEYIGTDEFSSKNIKDVVIDKKLKINIDEGSNKEFGKPMSDSSKTNIYLDISKADWYIYNENYGTSEEKYLIKFLDGVVSDLKKTYSDVYLLRNANLVKIYNFSDGRAIEPDFLLFLKKENSDKIEHYQLFIESKGDNLLEKDRWKEEFLKEIEVRYKITAIFGANEKYILVGFPFYNEEKKSEFVKIFKEKLGLR